METLSARKDDIVGFCPEKVTSSILSSFATGFNFPIGLLPDAVDMPVKWYGKLLPGCVLPPCLQNEAPACRCLTKTTHAHDRMNVAPGLSHHPPQPLPEGKGFRDGSSRVPDYASCLLDLKQIPD